MLSKKSLINTPIMPMRIRQSAAMVVMVSALFLVGNTANAGWIDWLWPFGSSVPQTETPEVGAQTPPPGGAPPPSGGTFTPPPSGDQGLQTQQPQQPPQTNTQQQLPQEKQPNQPGQPQTGQQDDPRKSPDWKPGPGDKFFCNSLGREASRPECDEADRAKSRQKDETKPPFPQGDEERMKKEQEEKFRTESEQSRKQEEEKMQREQEERMKKEEMMKKENEMRREQEEDMKKEEMMRRESEAMRCPPGEFPGINDQGQKSCIRKEGSMETQPFDGNEEFQEPERPQFVVDKNQIRETNRQLLELQRELNRILKSAKRLKGGEALVAEIEGLATSVKNFQQKFKSAQGEELQEAFEEFHDLRIWDTLNVLRSKIEIPKQLADAEKELKRTEKLLTQKAFKRLAEFGVNLDKIKSDLQNIRNTIETVRNLVNAGNFEEVQDAMQDIWQGMHPGEIQGVLHQTRGLTENLARIRNKDIRNEVLDIFQPVISAINEGDYREANMLLQELQKEMNRIFQQLYRVRTSELDDKLQKTLRTFESKILDKVPMDIGEERLGVKPEMAEESTGEEGLEEPRFFVDPQQLRQWVRETYDQQRELKRFLRSAQKLKDGKVFVTQIETLLATVTDFQKKLRTQKGDELQETVEAFHEARLWDEVNVLRARIELPKQLTEAEKSLKRVEKILKQKSFKQLANYGIDLGKIQADLDTMRSTIATTRKLLNEGNFEDAMETMRDVFEGSHPGEVEGALQRMRGLTEGFARIRDKDIRKGVQEIFQPVIDAINSGDYREAHALLSELEPQMKKIFAQLYRARKTLSKQLKKRLGEFEALIQEKLPKEEILPEEFEGPPEEELGPLGIPEEVPIF